MRVSVTVELPVLVAARDNTFCFFIVVPRCVFEVITIGVRVAVFCVALRDFNTLTEPVVRADTDFFVAERLDIERVFCVVATDVFFPRIVAFSSRVAASAPNTQKTVVNTKVKIFFISDHNFIRNMPYRASKITYFLIDFLLIFLFFLLQKLLIWVIIYCAFYGHMAELVDALVSGTSGSDTLEVRVFLCPPCVRKQV